MKTPKSRKKKVRVPVTLFSAAHDNEVAELRRLLDENEDIQAGGALRGVVDMNMNTPLHCAAYAGSHEACELLIECSKVDAVNRDGYTPFLFAVWGGHVKICELLLHKNANMHQRTTTFNTEHAIHLASRDEHFAIVDMLINRDVNLEKTRTKHGHTALHCACSTSRNLNVVQLLLMWCPNLIYLADNKGNTPLHIAVSLDSADLVRLLLMKRACANTQNNYGRTPLMMAQSEGLPCMVSVFQCAETFAYLDSTSTAQVMNQLTLVGQAASPRRRPNSSALRSPSARKKISAPLSTSRSSSFQPMFDFHISSAILPTERRPGTISIPGDHSPFAHAGDHSSSFAHASENSSPSPSRKNPCSPNSVSPCREASMSSQSSPTIRKTVTSFGISRDVATSRSSSCSKLELKRERLCHNRFLYPANHSVDDIRPILPRAGGGFLASSPPGLGFLSSVEIPMQCLDSRQQARRPRVAEHMKRSVCAQDLSLRSDVGPEILEQVRAFQILAAAESQFYEEFFMQTERKNQLMQLETSEKAEFGKMVSNATLEADAALNTARQGLATVRRHLASSVDSVELREFFNVDFMWDEVGVTRAEKLQRLASPTRSPVRSPVCSPRSRSRHSSPRNDGRSVSPRPEFDDAEDMGLTVTSLTR